MYAYEDAGPDNTNEWDVSSIPQKGRMMNVLKNRLESRKKEYADRKKHLMIQMEIDANSSTFEQNAINALLVMQELAAEIRTLEFAIQMEEIERNNA